MGKLQRHKVRILGQIRKNNRQNGQELEETNNNREMGCFPPPYLQNTGFGATGKAARKAAWRYEFPCTRHRNK